MQFGKCGIIRGMERIAIDTCLFSDIRKGGFVCVDKPVKKELKKLYPEMGYEG